MIDYAIAASEHDVIVPSRGVRKTTALATTSTMHLARPVLLLYLVFSSAARAVAGDDRDARHHAVGIPAAINTLFGPSVQEEDRQPKNYEYDGNNDVAVKSRQLRRRYIRLCKKCRKPRNWKQWCKCRKICPRPCPRTRPPSLCCVSAVNDEYAARDDRTELVVPASQGVAKNDRHSSCPFQLELDTLPKLGGDLTLNLEDGSFRYQPVKCGVETFTYTIATNDTACRSTATVKILVPGAEDLMKPKISCRKNVQMMFLDSKVPKIIRSASDNCFLQKTYQKVISKKPNESVNGPGSLLVKATAVDSSGNRNSCATKIKVVMGCIDYKCNAKEPCCEGYWCNDWASKHKLSRIMGPTCDLCRKEGQKCESDAQCCSKEGLSCVQQKCSPAIKKSKDAQRCQKVGEVCNVKRRCCGELKCVKKTKGFKKGGNVKRCIKVNKERKTKKTRTKTIKTKTKRNTKCRKAGQRCDSSKGKRCCSPFRCRKKRCTMPLWLPDRRL